jgi:hypothetical protein
MVYAPSTTIIQPENNVGGVPPYFESRLTNQQQALDDMRQNLHNEFQDVYNELGAQAINNEELERLADAVARLERGAMGSLPSYAASHIPSNSSSENAGGDSGAPHPPPSSSFSFNTRTMTERPPSVSDLSDMFSGMSMSGSRYQSAGSDYSMGTQTTQQSGNNPFGSGFSGGGSSGYGGGGGGGGGGFSGDYHSAGSYGTQMSPPGSLETGQQSRVSDNRSVRTVQSTAQPPLTISSGTAMESDDIYGSVSGGQGLGSRVSGLAPEDQIYGGSSSGSLAGSRVASGIVPQVQHFENLAQGAGPSTSAARRGERGHPFFTVRALYHQWRTAQDPDERRNFARMIISIAQSYNIASVNLSVILSRFEHMYNVSNDKR